MWRGEGGRREDNIQRVETINQVFVVDLVDVLMYYHLFVEDFDHFAIQHVTLMMASGGNAKHCYLIEMDQPVVTPAISPN